MLRMIVSFEIECADIANVAAATKEYESILDTYFKESDNPPSVFIKDDSEGSEDDAAGIEYEYIDGTLSPV